ncbi:MAG: YHS domain-containing (seleno)protein [Bradymonadia bacterium]
MRHLLSLLPALLAFSTLATTASAAPAAKEMARHAEKSAALGGYCPVAYAMAGKAIKGDKAYASTHDGKTYWFVNADAKAAFDKSPEKFLPEYAGYCATGIAFGQKVAVDPTQFSVREGRVFLFSNAETKAMFDRDAEKLTTKADTQWKAISAQHSSLQGR